MKQKHQKIFENFFRILVKKKYFIYYKTHPSYKKTKLFKLMNKKFFKNIVMLDNLIPSEIYILKNLKF